MLVAQIGALFSPRHGDKAYRRAMMAQQQAQMVQEHARQMPAMMMGLQQATYLPGLSQSGIQNAYRPDAFHRSTHFRDTWRCRDLVSDAVSIAERIARWEGALGIAAPLVTARLADKLDAITAKLEDGLAR